MYMRVSLRERKLSVSSISDKDFKRSTLRSKPRMVSSTVDLMRNNSEITHPSHPLRESNKTEETPNETFNVF